MIKRKRIKKLMFPALLLHFKLSFLRILIRLLTNETYDQFNQECLIDYDEIMSDNEEEFCKSKMNVAHEQKNMPDLNVVQQDEEILLEKNSARSFDDKEPQFRVGTRLLSDNEKNHINDEKYVKKNINQSLSSGNKTITTSSNNSNTLNPSTVLSIVPCMKADLYLDQLLFKITLF